MIYAMVWQLSEWLAQSQPSGQTVDLVSDCLSLAVRSSEWEITEVLKNIIHSKAYPIVCLDQPECTCLGVVKVKWVTSLQIGYSY